MDIKGMVDKHFELTKRIAELEKELKEVDAELLANSQVKDLLEGTHRNLRVSQNETIDDAKLRENISPSLFTSISVRKVDATLRNAAIKRGTISDSVINGCKVKGKKYLRAV